jgi:hypothetical protein
MKLSLAANVGRSQYGALRDYTRMPVADLADHERTSVLRRDQPGQLDTHLLAPVVPSPGQRAFPVKRWPFSIIGSWTSRRARLTFRYKDITTMPSRKRILQAEEFIRRFLLHVLSDGFRRIRCYDFLGDRYRERKLAHCRETLGHANAPTISLGNRQGLS